MLEHLDCLRLGILNGYSWYLGRLRIIIVASQAQLALGKTEHTGGEKAPRHGTLRIERAVAVGHSEFGKRDII